MAYIGNVPAEKYIALTQQTFSSPTGTSFTLSQAVTNSVDIDLYIDNVKQNPASYSVSGTALTTSTIASPSTMYCIFNGKAMQTVNPPDDSVGLAQLASGTDGNIISFDASGNPVAIATGNDGQVLTSTGAGSPPAFEAAAAGGKLLQVVSAQTGAVATGTTVMPYNDTIPQKTEGDEYLTVAITPAHASNTLYISVSLHGGHSETLGASTIAIFQDTTANALACGSQFKGRALDTNSMYLQYKMAAGTTSATTFKLRAGGGGSGTFTLNGRSSARIFGGVQTTAITVMEVSA